MTGQAAIAADPRPVVTVSHSWQGWIVRDPFMPRELAIGIFDDVDAAIDCAEEWADGAEMRVEVQR